MPAKASQKVPVISALFGDQSRWDQDRMIRSHVTLEEVAQAIEEYNKVSQRIVKLSSRNPANFFKDVGRKARSFANIWPKELAERGFLGRALKGEGNCFEFYVASSEELESFFRAFDGERYPKDLAKVIKQPVQSLSIDVMTRALARKDENLLQSVAVRLNIPEQHVALHDLGHQFLHLGHVQSNMKLRKAEVDGLYLGRLVSGAVVIIILEAKGASDDLNYDQIAGQMGAVKGMAQIRKMINQLGSSVDQAKILPMGMKLVSRKNLETSIERSIPAEDGKFFLYVCDFGLHEFSTSDIQPLKPQHETMFILKPPVNGLTA